MNTNLQDYSHKRFNILTGEWVLVSPHRAKRPWQGQNEAISNEVTPIHDPSCYLCAGNTRINGEENPKYEDVFVFTNVVKRYITFVRVFRRCITFVKIESHQFPMLCVFLKNPLTLTNCKGDHAQRLFETVPEFYNIIEMLRRRVAQNDFNIMRSSRCNRVS